MKTVWKWTLLLFCFLALSGYCFAAGVGQGAAGSQAGPAAQLSETSYDFGEMVESKEYVHDFKIKNVGTAPLEIKKVLPS
jgi:hypothetical protein